MNRSSRQSSCSRRSSILKLPKQSLTLNANGSSTENSPNIKQRRRVSFAEKKHVKEFCNSLEQGTVWNNTYEEHDSSHCKTSNSSNEAQEDLRNCNEENQIVSEHPIYINSAENNLYNQECNNEDDDMDLCESIQAPLTTHSYKNINYSDARHLEQVSDPQSQMAEYHSTLPNVSMVDVPIEFTEVVRPSSIQPSNYVTLCQYIHGILPPDSINPQLVDDSNKTSTMNANKIDENSLEFTMPIPSTVRAVQLESQLDKENIIPSQSTFQDIPMDFTAPITVLHNRVALDHDMIRKQAPLSQKVLLQEVLSVPNFKEAEVTSVFNDSSMEITKAVSVKSVPNMCNFNDNGTKMNSDKTSVFNDSSMEITKAVSVKSVPSMFNFNDNGIKMNIDKTSAFNDSSMEITKAVSIESFPNMCNFDDNGTKMSSNKTSAFNDSSMEITKAVTIESFPNMCNFDDNGTKMNSNKTSAFNDSSMEITKAVSIKSFPNMCDFDDNGTKMNSNKTSAFNDSSMEITKAVSVKSVPNMCNFDDNHTKMNSSKTSAFNDSSMEITKAVSVQSFPNTCNSNENNTNMDSSKTQIWSSDDMQMTTAIKDYCSTDNNELLKAIQNLQKDQETVTILQDKTTIFQDISMTITTAIPPHCRLTNGLAPFDGASLVSDFVSKEPQNAESSMQFDNESIEITKAIETPVVFSSHFVPEKESCTPGVYDKISTACDVENENIVYEDMSMEMTSAVNTQKNIWNAWNIADKENCPIDNKNPVNSNRKSSRKSISNAPIRKSILIDPLVDKENCSTSLENLPCNGRDIFPGKGIFVESNSILNQADCFLAKKTSIVSSQKIASSLTNKDYTACDATRDFSEVISVRNPQCDENQMILPEEQVCPSTCAFEKSNVATAELNGTNNEPAHATPNLDDTDTPATKISLQVFTLDASDAQQSCAMLVETDLKHLHEHENQLENSELFSDNLEEDLNSIKPPSFASIDDMDCDDADENNVSANMYKSYEEKVSNSTLAEPPITLSNTYQEYTYAGYNNQENNAVRACHLNALESDQTFLIARKSLGMTSIVIDDDETRQIIDNQAFHRTCADDSILTPIDCTSTLVDKSSNMMQNYINTSTDFESKSQITRESLVNNNADEPFDTSLSLINNSRNDSFTSTITNVHLNQSINAEMRNRLEEIFDEISVLETPSGECVTSNENVSSKNIGINDASVADTNTNEESILAQEDPFSSLLATLKNMVNSGDVIWDVYHVDIEKRKFVIGFISCSLLVSIVLEDNSVDFIYFQIERLRVVSRLRADSDILMRIAHRLLVEQINTEALLRSYKEHHNILQLLEDISTDVKLVLDFVIDLKRLKQLNLMTISDEYIAFTALTRRAEIILRVTMNIKVFSKLEPTDVHIDCLLGTVKEEDVRMLIKNVKRDHKFLRRYISDVRDYIYLMEN